MTVYALVKNGVVISRIVWDGPVASPLEFEPGITPYELADDQLVHVGFLYADGKFSPPPLTPEEIAEREAAARQYNVLEKERLMNEASQVISVLQDAVDLEMATDEEIAHLPLWKKYRVLLSRVNADTPQDVKWPTKPA